VKFGLVKSEDRRRRRSLFLGLCLDGRSAVVPGWRDGEPRRPRAGAIPDGRSDL